MLKKPKLGAVKKDGEPVLGMKFENSRDKLLHFKSSRQNPYLKESLIGQVEKHEGKDAAANLREEVNYKYDAEKKGVKKVDFIHNPNGKLQSQGWDNGKGKIYAWCNECGSRCYIYTIISDEYGHNIYRCSKCGTDCKKLTEKELNIKQEEK